MTVVHKIQATCHVCGTKYEGLELHSWFSAFPKPDIKPLACPQCHTPYKCRIGPQISLVCGLLPKIESDPLSIASTLVEYSLSQSDVELWRSAFLNLDEILEAAVRYMATIRDYTMKEKMEREVDMIKHLQDLAREGKYQRIVGEIIDFAKLLM